MTRIYILMIFGAISYGALGGCTMPHLPPMKAAEIESLWHSRPVNFRQDDREGWLHVSTDGLLYVQEADVEFLEMTAFQGKWAFADDKFCTIYAGQRDCYQFYRISSDMIQAINEDGQAVIWHIFRDQNE